MTKTNESMATAPRRRNVALDIIKGALVVIMLLYHCASVNPCTAHHVLLDKLYFIHSAFLLVTGFLCGYHYRKSALEAPRDVQKRLFERGLKVLAVFALANLLTFSLGFGAKGWARMTQMSGYSILTEFLFKVPGDLFAFEILYLIGLFLLLMSRIIHIRKIDWILILIGVSPAFIRSVPLLYLAFGCVGALAGIKAGRNEWKFFEPWIRERSWIFPMLLAPMIVFFPPPSEWIGGYGGRMAIVLSQTLIWFFSFVWIVQTVKRDWITNQIVLAGKYTLPAYLLQMLASHLVYRVLKFFKFDPPIYYLLALTIVGAGMIAMIWGIEQARRRSARIDGAYKFIFG